eukprot:TRINITY_DN61583_c0_g1_i1.p1 TRINITY_DN61583_c0_g1~~TRINITY_DN61583_c0_g1_i1.p1  ORF type:complete len:377 (+),score=39.76 TRINITY_DN61583_c0_g1_i1:75-1205(+)
MSLYGLEVITAEAVLENRAHAFACLLSLRVLFMQPTEVRPPVREQGEDSEKKVREKNFKWLLIVCSVISSLEVSAAYSLIGSRCYMCALSISTVPVWLACGEGGLLALSTCYLQMACMRYALKDQPIVSDLSGFVQQLVLGWWSSLHLRHLHVVKGAPSTFVIRCLWLLSNYIMDKYVIDKSVPFIQLMFNFDIRQDVDMVAGSFQPMHVRLCSAAFIVTMRERFLVWTTFIACLWWAYMYLDVGDLDFRSAAIRAAGFADFSSENLLAIVAALGGYAFTRQNFTSSTPHKATDSSTSQDCKAEDPYPSKEDTRSCVVCQNNAAKVVLVPCGHFCLCLCCAKHWGHKDAEVKGRKDRKQKLCPVCRAEVEQTLQVF